MERVPETIDKNVQRLAQKVGSEENPLYIEVITESYAIKNECIAAVEEKIKRDNGSRQLGWQIWEMPGVFIEAEFHAVWMSPNGTLIDIKPKTEQIKKILFIPDSKVKYDGSRIDNIRLNISGNRLVDDFIRICVATEHFKDRGKRAYQRMTVLSGTEAGIYKDLMKLKAMLLFMIKNNSTRNSFCFCGSGKKYKHCHSYELDHLIGKSKIENNKS
jgi:hypothetical protein